MPQFKTVVGYAAAAAVVAGVVLVGEVVVWLLDPQEPKVAATTSARRDDAGSSGRGAASEARRDGTGVPFGYSLRLGRARWLGETDPPRRDRRGMRWGVPVSGWSTMRTSAP